MMTRMTAEMKRIFEQMNKDQKVRMFYELAKYISDNANENVEDNDIQNLFNDITDIHIVRSDLKLKLLRRSDFEFWKRASEKFL